jgi:hypothetical protein
MQQEFQHLNSKQICVGRNIALFHLKLSGISEQNIRMPGYASLTRPAVLNETEQGEGVFS